ncbi:MAG TPA: outer membrane beta-barrel protein [Bryobacteraceae bacterium]|nr:outer membrane beta-barrel protein [Bryobacteraceae bacterium]
MKNLKPLLSAVVAISAILGIGAASAADLPMKAVPYAAPVPVFSWTGCYVGVHAGAGAMRNSVAGGSLMAVGSNYTGNGGLAGGQLGCNYQDSNWVFGIEGEGYWSGMKTNYTDLNSAGFGETYNAKNKNDFSIAARAGIAFDRTLVYGKAGWVWGQFDFLSTDNCCSIGSFSSSSASGTLDGLLLGVGIEHAFINNWTVKLEYNYLNFGSKAVAFTSCSTGSGPTTCFADGTGTVRAEKQIFKIGANYLFNMGSAPLVAKY